jgi:hypothetical protein
MGERSSVTCSTCKATAAMRINRNGFLQRKVLGLVGIYPWKCGACGAVFLYRRRGHRPRPGSTATEPEGGPQG